MKRRITLLLLAVLALPAVAEEPGDDIETIVVTGSRTKTQIEELSTTTTVLRLQDLEAINPVSIPDSLRQLPGVHVVQPSGQGGVARVFIRGGEQNLTMVLLDGIRVNDPNDSRGTPFDFSTVNLNDVERIEIVRGPQSAVYGSDALAGVINIISKDTADELGSSVLAEVGSDDFRRASIDVAGPIGEGGFSLRVATKDDGEPVTGSTFTSDMVSGRASFGRSDSWQLRLFGSYADSEGTAFPEDSGGSDLAVIRATDARSATSARMGLTGRVPLSDRWNLNFLATWYDLDTSFASPGIAPGVRDGVPPNGADANLERTGAALNAVVDVSASLTATFGMDYYDEDGVSDGYVEFFPGFNVPAGFASSRSVTGAFGELHYTTEAGPVLMASTRRDDANTEHGETTHKLGVLHQFANGRTTLRANWGQGFKLPIFFSLASPLVGNPDLVPEKSESYDLGVSHQFTDTRFEFSASVFRNEFRDIADFDPELFLIVNRGRLNIDGVELQLGYVASDSLSVRVQATHLDIDAEEPLRQRPDWRAGLSLRWAPSDKWLLDSSWLYTGKTWDTSVPTGAQWLDSYNRMDTTLTYRHSDDLQAVLSVTNLFDEDYHEAIGFPAPGARARLGLRYAF